MSMQQVLRRKHSTQGFPEGPWAGRGAGPAAERHSTPHSLHSFLTGLGCPNCIEYFTSQGLQNIYHLQNLTIEVGPRSQTRAQRPVPGQSRPPLSGPVTLFPVLTEGGKVGQSGKTLLPETKPDLVPHVWLLTESAARPAVAGRDPARGPGS